MTSAEARGGGELEVEAAPVYSAMQALALAALEREGALAVHLHLRSTAQHEQVKAGSRGSGLALASKSWSMGSQLSGKRGERSAAL